MIDTLSSDIEKEMAVATSEEKNAQADYEETIKARQHPGEDETAITNVRRVSRCCCRIFFG